MADKDVIDARAGMAASFAGPPAARASLDALFIPQSVAVIGATEAPGSVGRTLVRNLILSPFGGTIYPVNPKRASVQGIRAYPTIADVPAPVDLAVIATPAPTVPALIGQCAAAGVKGAIVISAGFRETGPQGLALEQQILNEARRGGMRIVGPNCLGVMNPLTGMNATFAHGVALPGSVAMLSQSGALLTSILDWSVRERVGFSAVASTGSMLDVTWGDWIDYLGDDPRTKSILIYMESIGDARSFLSAAREVSLNKPIIVIKPGRSEAAARAAASHTGAMTGSDDVLDAAFRRAGVLRVETIADLFSMAEVLAKQPRPSGRRLAIVTNAGGPGVLATDALLANGGKLAGLSDETRGVLDVALPPQWSHNNPVDVLGDAPPDRFATALKAVAADPGNDGVLVILTPQDMTDPTRTAEALKPFANVPGKPLLASWMGGADVAAGQAILSAAGVPTFEFPDQAAKAFTYMWRYAYNLRALYETPALARTDAVRSEDAARLIAAAREAGRELLDEAETKELLACYGIPVTRTLPAATSQAAADAADSLGYPVVLKLLSKTLTHKTDVGGVMLNLTSRDQVIAAFDDVRQSVAATAGEQHFQGVTVQPMVRTLGAYELIAGSSPDPQFGPVMLFGTGGQLVEVFKDRALGFPPLNATLARRMIEQTRVATALHGVRGRKAVDLAALDHLLVRFSQLVVEQPWIKEIEVNPLIAGADTLIAVDARATLWPRTMAEQDLPRPAIRPYPLQYVTRWQLDDGTPILVRPMQPEDEPLIVKFHEALSEQSVRQRYFHAMKLTQRTAHERLTRVCFADYDRELAFVMETRAPDGSPMILGVGRLSRYPGRSDAEFALLIADAWQRRGLGRRMLDWLIDVARRERIQRLFAPILGESIGMQRLAETRGFELHRSLTDSTVNVTLDL